MEGLIEVIIGAVGVIVGVILRLPSASHWMEDDIDARLPQTPLRKVHWLEGIVDWHYRTSRKWALIIIGPFFLFVGLGMIVIGIAELTSSGLAPVGW